MGSEGTAIGAHPEESKAAVVFQAENNPATVRRVRADEGVDVATLVVGKVVQVRSISVDGRYICRLTRVGEIGVRGHDYVVTVRCPVLFDCDVKSERRELKEVGAVTADGE